MMNENAPCSQPLSNSMACWAHTGDKYRLQAIAADESVQKSYKIKTLRAVSSAITREVCVLKLISKYRVHTSIARNGAQ